MAGNSDSSGSGSGNSGGHGGARPGAGRKPKALAYADTAALVEEKIAAALPDITDALISFAKGGDVASAKYLMDRILGRVATIETAPAGDTRPPFTEEDAEVAAAKRKSERELERLLAGA